MKDGIPRSLRTPLRSPRARAWKGWSTASLGGLPSHVGTRVWWMDVVVVVDMVVVKLSMIKDQVDEIETDIRDLYIKCKAQSIRIMPVGNEGMFIDGA